MCIYRSTVLTRFFLLDYPASTGFLFACSFIISENERRRGDAIIEVHRNSCAPSSDEARKGGGHRQPAPTRRGHSARRRKADAPELSEDEIASLIVAVLAERGVVSVAERYAEYAAMTGECYRLDDAIAAVLRGQASTSASASSMEAPSFGHLARN